MIGIRNNIMDYKLSLPLARHIKTSDPRGKSEVSKEVISEFIQRTVSTKSKTNHTKYCGGTIKQTLPDGNITIRHTSGDLDPDVIEKLLHGHPLLIMLIVTMFFALCSGTAVTRLVLTELL